eukprot:GHVP01003826.1.p1 GENE.GHVP01003826.1~~GHVP01003826.1.p1  ORF type:complete len:100 (-),score=12.09 GHVP01003826.1:405-704(-)
MPTRTSTAAVKACQFQEEIKSQEIDLLYAERLLETSRLKVEKLRQSTVINQLELPHHRFAQVHVQEQLQEQKKTLDNVSPSLIQTGKNDEQLERELANL